VTGGLGVDLGTTFVAAALARPTGVEMLTLGERTVVLPAVVAVGADGHLVAGDVAERRATTHPAAREVRRRLGDPAPVRLGPTSYPVVALLGALLQAVARSVVDAEGRPPRRVALTHPAHWGRYRRDLLAGSAASAGLPAARLVPEPVAVVHHLLAADGAASGPLREGGVVAVYDLGGGTFDATVVRRTAGGPEILGRPESIERLGGVDFDEAVLSYVDEFAGGALAGLDLCDPGTATAVARLRQECVAAKEVLSADSETTVPVLLPGRHFEVPLTRASFEDMIRSAVGATVTALTRTVESAGLHPADLSCVLLTGGSSRIPLVRELVSRELGRPVVDAVHPKHAVALGAASLLSQGG
jgi:molecular chaperone DnaK (HSP70)